MDQHDVGQKYKAEVQKLREHIREARRQRAHFADKADEGYTLYGEGLAQRAMQEERNRVARVELQQMEKRLAEAMMKVEKIEKERERAEKEKAEKEKAEKEKEKEWCGCEMMDGCVMYNVARLVCRHCRCRASGALRAMWV